MGRKSQTETEPVEETESSVIDDDATAGIVHKLAVARARLDGLTTVNDLTTQALDSIELAIIRLASRIGQH